MQGQSNGTHKGIRDEFSRDGHKIDDLAHKNTTEKIIDEFP